MEFYKETTPTRFARESESVYNYVCTHKIARINSAVRNPILLMLETDYAELVAERDELKATLDSLDIEQIMVKLPGGNHV